MLCLIIEMRPGARISPISWQVDTESYSAEAIRVKVELLTIPATSEQPQWLDLDPLSCLCIRLDCKWRK